MRRKDRELTNKEDMIQIIENAKILRIALFDDDYPYVVPMHYGYTVDDSKIVFYMHSAKEGHKLDLISKDPNVCLEVENDMEIVSGGDVPCQYGAKFSSVIARGKAEIIEDIDEKIKGLKLLMVHQVNKDFEINEQMANMVCVIKITVEQITAKERK